MSIVDSIIAIIALGILFLLLIGLIAASIILCTMMVIFFVAVILDELLQ